MTDYLKQYNKRKNASNRSNNADQRPGEIWRVSNLDGVKDRPLLVISRSGDAVAYRKCTSSTVSVRLKDIIEDYISEGLEKRYVRSKQNYEQRELYAEIKEFKRQRDNPPAL